METKETTETPRNEDGGAVKSPNWSAAWFVAAVLMLAGALLFWNVQDNDYVYNDFAFFVENPNLGDSGHLRRLFTPAGAEQTLTPAYYSPMTDLSFALEKLAYGRGPNATVPASTAHSIELILYLAICAMAFWIFALSTRRVALAAIAGALFLVHPMHTENVNYVASRSENLGALFTFATILIALPRPGAAGLRAAQGVGAFFAALFAMLSAPIGFLAPFLVLALDVARSRAGETPIRTRSGAAYIGLGLSLLLGLGLRFALFGSLVSRSEAHAFFESGGGFGAVGQTLFRYLTLSVAPHPQTLIYNPMIPGEHAFLIGPAAAWGAIAVVAVAAVLIGMKLRWVGLGLAWFTLAIAAYLPFTPTYEVISESRLLVPSAGICLAIAALIAAIRDPNRVPIEGVRNNLAMAIVVILIAGFAAMSWTRGKDWKSPEQLWSAEERMHPDSELVLQSLGFYSAMERDREQALEYYRRAYENYRSRPSVFHEYAILLVQNGMPDEAREVLSAAMEQKDIENPDYYRQIGLVYEQLREWEKAQRAYAMGVDRDPEDWSLRFGLGVANHLRREFETANDHYTQALDLAEGPSQETATRINRARARIGVGDLDRALEDIRAMREVDPSNPQPYILESELILEEERQADEEGMSQEEISERRLEAIRQAVSVLIDADRNLPSPNEDVLLRLAYFGNQVGDLRFALDYAQRAWQRFPKQRTAVFYGTLLIQARLFEDAWRHYIAVLRQDPAAARNPHIMAGAGFATFETGNLERAADYAEEALRIRKTHPLALLLYRRLVNAGIGVDFDPETLPPEVRIPFGLEEVDFGGMPLDDEAGLEELPTRVLPSR